MLGSGRDGGGDRPKLHLIAMVWGAVGLLALVVSVVATNVAVAIFGGLALVAAGGAYAVQNARDRSAAETERTLAGGPSMAPGDLAAPPPRMSMGRLLGTEDRGVAGGRRGGPSTRADMDGVAEALDPFSGRSEPAPFSDPVDAMPSDPTPSEAAGPEPDDAAGPGPDDAVTDEDSAEEETTGDDGTDRDGGGGAGRNG